MRFFRRKDQKTLPTTKIDYPSGTCVRTETGVWYLKGKMKHRVSSHAILESWNFRRIIRTSDVAISGFQKGSPLGFRDGTVIRDFSNNKTYVISDNKKRHIKTPEFLVILGIDLDGPLVVSNKEASLHREGEVIE